ncbi:MAG: hypothetical protein MJ240_12510 [Kiritimatiellae bacterium]|nr:hypothetical protein [Kiritimatiellia bacterium]
MNSPKINSKEKKVSCTSKKRKIGRLNISVLILRGRRRERTLARAWGRIRSQPNAAMQAAAEAVSAFDGTSADYRSWEGAAYALGHERFYELFFLQRAENAADGPPHDVRRAFQAKLSRAIGELLKISEK